RATAPGRAAPWRPPAPEHVGARRYPVVRADPDRGQRYTCNVSEPKGDLLHRMADAPSSRPAAPIQRPVTPRRRLARAVIGGARTRVFVLMRGHRIWQVVADAVFVSGAWWLAFFVRF